MLNQPNVKPRWASLKQASRYSGIGTRALENAIAGGILRSSLVLSFPGAKRGRRLVDLLSLDSWIEEGVGRRASLPYLVNNQRKGGIQ